MSWLVAEAANAIADERAGRELAANEAIVNAVKDVRYQGGHEVHQQLQGSLEYTGNPEDVLTAEEIADAIEATGGTAPTHAVIGKEIRRLWKGTKGDRVRLDGRQQRVIRCVKAKNADS